MTNEASEQVNIFISHKSEDESAALEIKRVLKDFDDEKNPRMIFFHSEEIPGGSNWYEWITSKLIASNLLLLLFTDATRSWDWCLYEAGLFDDLSDNSQHRRTICLHSSSTDPPDPLKHLQAFSAKPADINKFLKQLLLGTELTGLSESLAGWITKVPERLDEAAQIIANLIDRKPVDSEWYSKYIFIHIQHPETLEPSHIPPDAKVKSSEKSLEIFGRPRGDWTWKQLEEKARLNDDQRWLDELAQGIYAAAKGDLPEPIQANFQSRHDPHGPYKFRPMYRPTLYRADTLADGSMVFKVLFTEDVSWRLTDTPPRLHSLLTSLVMGTRFKYELIDKYLGFGGRLVTGMSAEKLCKEILKVILTIEAEGRSRGLLDRQNLIAAFDKEEDRLAINEMYDTWFRVRNNLVNDLEKNNTESVEQIFLELADVNKRFLALASGRFQEFVSR